MQDTIYSIILPRRGWQGLLDNEHSFTIFGIILIIIAMYFFSRHIKNELRDGMEKIVNMLGKVLENSLKEWTNSSSTQLEKGISQLCESIKTGTENGFAHGLKEIMPEVKELIEKLNAVAANFDKRLDEIARSVLRIVGYPQKTQNVALKSLIEEVEDLIYEKKFDAAKAKVDNLLSKHKASPDIAILEARYHAAILDFTNAEAAMQRAEQLLEKGNLGDIGEILFTKSRLLSAQNKPIEAELLCRQALDHDGKDARYLNSLGFFCWRNDRIEEALQVTLEAAKYVDDDNRTKELVLNNLTFYFAEIAKNKKDASKAALSLEYATRLENLGRIIEKSIIKPDKIKESIGRAYYAYASLVERNMENALKGLKYATEAIQLNPANTYAVELILLFKELIEKLANGSAPKK